MPRKLLATLAVFALACACVLGAGAAGGRARVGVPGHGLRLRRLPRLR